MSGPDSPDSPDTAGPAGPGDGVGGTGLVAVVGTGLLGASVAMGLRRAGIDVALSDTSPTALALATDLGAGRPITDDDEPVLVVVAAPPDVTAGVVGAALARYPGAVVTDVASVKAGIAAELRERGVGTARYVGSHPMAGRERSGAIAARGDLFLGRPWVLCPTPTTTPGATAAVSALATVLGAPTSRLEAADHDEAVALVSHLPQVAASLVAGRLAAADPGALDLTGQGLRDVTRIAASDPALWTAILAANAVSVGALLTGVRDDLDRLLSALADLAGPEDPADRADPAPHAVPAAAPVGGTAGERDDAGPRPLGPHAVIASLLGAGVDGAARIPGKHGAAATPYAVVTVLVADAPGELARLFADVSAAGVNLEELHLDHSPGRAVGLVEVSVAASERAVLLSALGDQGWAVHEG